MFSSFTSWFSFPQVSYPSCILHALTFIFLRGMRPKLSINYHWDISCDYFPSLQKSQFDFCTLNWNVDFKFVSYNLVLFAFVGGAFNFSNLFLLQLITLSLGP